MLLICSTLDRHQESLICHDFPLLIFWDITVMLRQISNTNWRTGELGTWIRYVEFKPEFVAFSYFHDYILKPVLILWNTKYVIFVLFLRPLPEELIKYAREDTHYLLYIYDKMTNELLEQGNQQSNLVLSTIQRSTQVCARVSEYLETCILYFRL